MASHKNKKGALLNNFALKLFKELYSKAYDINAIKKRYFNAEKIC